MALEYKKDKINEGSKTLASIKGDRLNKGTGFTTLCNIKDDKVRDKTGFTVICNIKNGEVREKSGFKRLAKIKDIRKEIKNSESLSDAFVAAVWWYLIK